MKASKVITAHDPCLQIQADLSAMLDGELAAQSVRRVMIHSDVCASCREFLRSIREQAKAHRELDDAGAIVDGEVVENGRGRDAASEHLRRELMDNRLQLGRILYELGRGFALMGLSPKFSKIVGREPVPIPDMTQKGRNLVAEIEEMAGDAPSNPDAEWVRAKELFDSGSMASPTRNLAKGERLLRECVAISPEYFEAWIYLGMVHHVQDRHEDALEDLEVVRSQSEDPSMQGFARLNMGNVYLDRGDVSEAIAHFEAVVESGLAEREVRFRMVYFNLGVAHGLSEAFDESRRWFARLQAEMPHKRTMVARELELRQNLRNILDAHPSEAARYAEQFPAWFPIPDPHQTKAS